MNDELKSITKLISENKIDQAINYLLELTKDEDDVKIQVIGQSAKLKDLRKKELLGILDNRDIELAQAKIVYALLEIINELKQKVKTVFISYNNNDADIAKKLAERLKAKNISVIIDSEQMKAGDDIRSFIESSVRDSEATISIISSNSLLSDWVAMESINTFNNEKTNSGKKFIACYLEDDFFKPGFTDNVLNSIHKKIEEIQGQITKRAAENQGIADLNNKSERLRSLEFNMDKIIGRLRDCLCVDIRGSNFENNLDKIVQAINA
jgi:TIR domain/Effector-associated domain 11